MCGQESDCCGHAAHHETGHGPGHGHDHGAACGCRGRTRGVGGQGGGAVIEPAVLAALLRDCGHGYDLRKTIEDLGNGSISVDPGGLYRTLRRLEDDGFVSSSWIESEAGPQRRTYELNAEGRDLARDWIAHLRTRVSASARIADLLEQGLAEGGTGR
ncbi:MAG: PadR family transcriptional regulator [Coriobacteriia bacterium]